jgi:SAM-dependent methyltransferase
MTFSSEWNELYARGAQNSVWPWSDLVSYVMRYSRPDRRPFRVLELGFGAGANIQFLLSIGADYYGIEGSAEAVGRVRERFRDSQNMTLACGDFTKEIPFEGPFDLVIDRSSVTHNAVESIRRCIALVHARLRPGGKFMGIDWFSTANSDFLKGKNDGDYYSRLEFAQGQFKGVGRVHFADTQHLKRLLTSVGFDIERLEHKVVETAVPADAGLMAWWNFVVVKQ